MCPAVLLSSRHEPRSGCWNRLGAAAYSKSAGVATEKQSLLGERSVPLSACAPVLVSSVLPFPVVEELRVSANRIGLTSR